MEDRAIDSAALSAGMLAAYYNVPILPWGTATTSTLFDPTQYPTAAMVTVDTYK